MPLLRTLVKPVGSSTAPNMARMVLSEPFDAPIEWFVYGHLHFILALPTLTLLALSPPLQRVQPLQRQAAYAFVGFIVCVGVTQSYIWDAYGATLGIWQFNPDKCTLRESFPLPIEEVLWLFHHVLKTALYQLKAFEFIPAQTERGAPSPEVGTRVSAALVVAIAFGVWALGFSSEDSVKCIGLVFAFFAPVWLLIWQVGGQFFLRHANRMTLGWLAPGVTTTLIDCLGQQQGVWRFPESFLSGISFGYLKLDIVLVYMVSTFAVTASGAVVLAATEELLARRAAGMQRDATLSKEKAFEDGERQPGGVVGSAALGVPGGVEGMRGTDSLGDVLKYIVSGRLAVCEEGDVLPYVSTCTVEGCSIDQPAQFS